MKVYETVLLKRAETVLAKRGIDLPRLSKEGLNYMQGAGKRKHGTPDVMADLLSMQKQMAKWALLSFDLSKAFDRVSIKGLILKLHKRHQRQASASDLVNVHRSGNQHQSRRDDNRTYELPTRGSTGGSPLTSPFRNLRGRPPGHSAVKHPEKTQPC